MQDIINKKIVLGICGSIAAYKAAYLMRELVQLGAEVRVVLTASAQQFISPLTCQALTGHAVRTDLFDLQAERAMGHIELARWADFLIIAPASANCIAKLANGFADDLLSTLYLVTEAPVIICPAMNKSMWQHPATQANCKKLLHQKNILLGPDAGEQACGDIGPGRLIETHAIINAIKLYGIQERLSGQKIVITAGPTQEALDPVRFFSNRSSGKMGYAMAEAAHFAGADVILVSGPTTLSPPHGVTLHLVNTAQEMHDNVMECLDEGMIFIATAAVADYRVAAIAKQKIKKHLHDELTLTLLPNPDILARVVQTQKASLVVGFAAETNDEIYYGKHKLQNKTLDMIVVNRVGENMGFHVEENKVTVLTKDKQIDLPLMHKMQLAAQLIAIIADTLQNK